MMQKITIPSSDLWGYFLNHKKELEREEHIIAENEEYGVQITITNEGGLPYFIVTADDYQYEDAQVTNAEDCKNIAERLYENYLTEKFITSSEEGEDDESLFTQEDMISEREANLDDAIVLLLDEIMEDDSTVVLQSEGTFDEICDDIKEHILEYLARKYNMSSQIRRPMIMEDVDTGEDFFTEYPYEYMIYEDDDNPVYKK